MFSGKMTACRVILFVRGKNKGFFKKQKIKRIRKEKDISQGEIGRILEVDKGFISNIEAGKTNPTLATIAKIAKAIGVSVVELMK